MLMGMRYFTGGHIHGEIGEVRLAFKTNIRLSLIWHEDTHLQYISSPCDINRPIRSRGTIPATSFQPIHVLTIIVVLKTQEL